MITVDYYGLVPKNKMLMAIVKEEEWAMIAWFKCKLVSNLVP